MTYFVSLSLSNHNALLLLGDLRSGHFDHIKGYGLSASLTLEILSTVVLMRFQAAFQ